MKYEIQELRCAMPYVRAYKFGKCKVVVGDEPVVGWHMSISHPTRYPRWEEIKDARYKFCPLSKTMAMFLPPQAEWVNIHNNCFHLYEHTDNDKLRAENERLRHQCVADERTIHNLKAANKQLKEAYTRADNLKLAAEIKIKQLQGDSDKS